MEEILKRFSLLGRPLSCERFGQGHINQTYLVTTDRGRRYILQRLSRAAFSDIPALMRNVAAVTSFLAARSSDPRQTLHLIPTRDGGDWVRDEAGEEWRSWGISPDEDRQILRVLKLKPRRTASGVATITVTADNGKKASVKVTVK